MPYLGSLVMRPSAQLQLLAVQGISFFVNGIGMPASANSASMAWLGSGQPSGYATPETKRHLGYRIGLGGVLRYRL
jgi:hypothetical protein